MQRRQFVGQKDRLAIGIGIGVCARQPATVQGVLHLKQHDRGTGDDAVEIVGIAHRLHQRLAAAIRTAVEIAVGGGLAVKRLGQGLGGQRGDVLGAMDKIGARPIIKAPLRPHARMAHVGGSHDEPAVVQHLTARRRTRAQRDVAAQPATADLQVALGPGRHRQKNLKIQLRRQRAGDRTDGNAIAARLLRR